MRRSSRYRETSLAKGRSRSPRATCSAIIAGGVEDGSLEAHLAGQVRQLVMGRGQPLAQLALQPLGLEQIAHPDAPARDLVLVGRSDAPSGGADGRLAQRALPQEIELLVPGEDDVRVQADLEPRAVELEVALLELVDLAHQHRGVDHHPIADHAGLSLVQDPRGDQVQHRLLAAHHEGVTGVVATLEADDDLDMLGEEIHQLALALITPLRTHHDDVRHRGPALSCVRVGVTAP